MVSRLRWSALAFLLVSAPAWAAGKSKTGTGQIASAAQKTAAAAAVDVTLGAPGSDERAGKLGTIAAFVNEHGCVVDANGQHRAAAAEIEKAISAVLGRFDLVYVAMSDMHGLFGMKVIAFGLCGEGRKNLALPLSGMEDADVVAYTTEDGKAAEVSSSVFTHEILHIALNQLGNERLGGGEHKYECNLKKVGNLHHSLTSILGINGAGQGQGSEPDWKPGKNPPSC